VDWLPAASFLGSTKNFRVKTLLHIANRIATYNRQRAVTFARNYLGRAWRNELRVLRKEHTYLRLEAILNMLPLLSGDSIYDGPETVVLFGLSELPSDWNGASALMGSRTLERPEEPWRSGQEGSSSECSLMD
jgi:hypothetical protein